METTEKEAGYLIKLCVSQEERNSSSSSVQELQAIQELSSAHKRVSREDRTARAEGKCRRSFVSPLGRQLSTKLDKLDLLHSRVSVIARTPTRSPANSTPSCSPLALPNPPRNCQPLDQSNTPQIHSASCSDISSIHSEVFSTTEEVQTSKVPVPVSKGNLGIIPIMSANPVKFIVGSTRPEEKDILVKESSVYYKMGQLGPAEVTKATLKVVDSHVKWKHHKASVRS